MTNTEYVVNNTATLKMVADWDDINMFLKSIHSYYFKEDYKKFDSQVIAK